MSSRLERKRQRSLIFNRLGLLSMRTFLTVNCLSREWVKEKTTPRSDQVKIKTLEKDRFEASSRRRTRRTNYSMTTHFTRRLLQREFSLILKVTRKKKKKKLYFNQKYFHKCQFLLSPCLWCICPLSIHLSKFHSSFNFHLSISNTNRNLWCLLNKCSATKIKCKTKCFNSSNFTNSNILWCLTTHSLTTLLAKLMLVEMEVTGSFKITYLKFLTTTEHLCSKCHLFQTELSHARFNSLWIYHHHRLCHNQTI